VRFCSTSVLWEHSARWFIGPFKATGLDWQDVTPRTKAGFITALSSWILLGPYTPRPLSDDPQVEIVHDLLRRKIRHIVRLAPQKEKLNKGLVEPLDLPTLQEFRYKWQSLTQKQAAKFLRCDPRTVRLYIKKGELTKLKGGRVSCDDNWARKL